MLRRCVSTATRVARPAVLRAPATAVRPAVRLSSTSASSAAAPATLTPTEADAMMASARITPAISRIAPIVMRSASGSWVTTVDGQRFLDFTSGIGVVSTGHSHPHVVAAVQHQAATLVHGQVNIGMHEGMIKLADMLAKDMPQPTASSGAKGAQLPLDTFFFWNSGAEAVEASIKLARQATGKPNIIVMQGSYHGRTYGTMALTTSKTIYRAGFSPLPSGVFVAPYPYASQLPQCVRSSPAAMSDYCLQSIEMMLKQQTAPSETAAIILEPILGEGGYVVPPDGFLAGLRSLCDRHKLLLIADEVQSGCGRTGKMWAMQHWGVQPDILIFAKGIASGYPLSGIAASKQLMSKQPPGSMGGTYSGNAVACAAAIATLEVFEKEQLVTNTVQRGAQLVRRLNDMKRDPKVANGVSGGIAEVRGLGLMQAIQFSDKAPYGFAGRVSQICREKGMLVLTTSIFETLRFIPALNVTAAEIDTACDILHAAIVTAGKQMDSKKLY